MTLDNTIRVYLFPDLHAHLILDKHRSAVNAISLCGSYIASGSGDRSLSLWDAKTGTLLRTFEDHHTRGYVERLSRLLQLSRTLPRIASIDFLPPFVVSGSSDKHLRLLDISTNLGWSTSSSPSPAPVIQPASRSSFGHVPTFAALLSSPTNPSNNLATHAHQDLVRSVAMNEDFIVSGSYDGKVKVWDTKTGEMISHLETGGHTGRIFCVAFDRKKVFLWSVNRCPYHSFYVLDHILW